MEAFGVVVIAVIVVGVVVGVLLLRRPNPWDEIGAGGFADTDAPAEHDARRTHGAAPRPTSRGVEPPPREPSEPSTAEGDAGVGGYASADADEPDGPSFAAPPTPADDEADLRALLARKRAARRERDGLPPEPDDQPDTLRSDVPTGVPWAHIDRELLDEARALVARRRDRLSRQSKPDIDEHEELIRILGPPHA